MIKLKENKGSPIVQITINEQAYKEKRSIKYIFDIKGHKFILQKPENEIIYKFFIDSICLDDLMPNNKKHKKNILENQMFKMDCKTMLIKPVKNINNKNNKDRKKNDDDFSGTGSDIYKSSKKEEKKEVEQNDDDIPEYEYLFQKIINADNF